jgi:hypothetical protein
VSNSEAGPENRVIRLESAVLEAGPQYDMATATLARYGPLMRTVLACLVMLVLGLSAQVACAYEALGPGVISCGTWTAERRTPNAITAVMAESWVLGFLSGIGFVGQSGSDPLHGSHAEAVSAWIDNYCKANPLDSVGKAATMFYFAHPR